MVLQVLKNINLRFEFAVFGKDCLSWNSHPQKSTRNRESFSNLVPSFVHFPRLALELLPLPR